MKSLLLEIGSEEIPAGYIKPALDALSSILKGKLLAARIDCGEAEVFGGPKRLAIIIKDVSEKQESLETEIMGPPEKIGFDESGKATVAGEKFAEKAGVPISEVRIIETKKGRYLCADKREAGGQSVDILSTLLPEAITAIPFPKTMRWSDLTLEFARPILTIVALLGESVIPFTLGNLTSGRETLGHRFMNNEKFSIPSPDKYVETLRSANVIADLSERRKMVEGDVNSAARGLGGRILPDEELIDIVNNLVEYPVAVGGKFDKEFLEVPDEVLITAMRVHQKYFAVIDEEEKLMPCFIAVNNTKAKDMSLVATGHERVLRARLSDAQFFYRADLEESSDSRVEKLKGVLFQAKLGNMHEKILRVQEIAKYLANEVSPETSLADDAARAAWLCKSDLVSQVVVEFPKLQGVMGRVYARVAGEPDAVASAIEEHYRPTYSGAKLPETETGAVLAIADKMDSITGCFSVGLTPTGASDPYALRRQGIGIIQIMLSRGFSFSLTGLIEKCADLFGDKSTEAKEETVQKIYTFLKNRLGHILEEQGFSKDVIAAITDVSADHLPNTRRRVEALEKLKGEAGFEPLAVSFKRVVNIIRKSGESVTGDAVDESLFEHECESVLYAKYNEVRDKAQGRLREGAFESALLDIASMKEAVDGFFDGAMVMAEDEKIRNNRLLLLSKISSLFGNFADFSKIST